jgi:hypothetical protein
MRCEDIRVIGNVIGGIRKEMTLSGPQSSLVHIIRTFNVPVTSRIPFLSQATMRRRPEPMRSIVIGGQKMRLPAKEAYARLQQE